MASEWQKTSARLSSLVTKIRSGATPKGGADSYLPARQRYALVRSQNVFDHRFDEKGLAFISDQQAQDLAGAELQTNDVLLNITGDGITFGRACLVPSHVLPACVNQHVMLIRTNRDLCYPRYLAAWLALPSTKAHIESFNSGGSRRAITKGHIESFDVPLPPIELQRIIGDLSANLNDCIDNLRQTNATLEAIATALFKSWFVDFDGVLPEGMQESELGLIPKGWRVAPLEEHVDAERGLSYKGVGLAEAGAGVPMHNLNSVLEFGGYKYAGIKYYNGDYKEKHLTVGGDIIVANTEQGHEHRLIGFPAIVPGSYTSGLFSHHLYRVRIKAGSPVTREWLYHCLMAPAVREQIIGCSNGSTVNMLKPDGLKIPRFALPPHELCKKFDAIAAPLRLKAETNVEQMKTLAALRDTLLPRLISGQLRVNQ